jgi:hypothetical protein
MSRRNCRTTEQRRTERRGEEEEEEREKIKRNEKKEMTKKGDDNEVCTPLCTTMNMTDDNVLCQTPPPFNRTMTMPTAQTDDDDKHNPAVLDASTEKPSR